MAEPNPSPRRGHHEIWGDDPEEVDASAVVEQIETAFPEADRRWHDHPFVAPFKAVALFIKRSGKRIAVTIAGFAVLIVGIAMLVLPGPGKTSIAMPTMRTAKPAIVTAIRLPLRLMKSATALKGATNGWSCHRRSASGNAVSICSTTADASTSSGSSPQISWCPRRGDGFGSAMSN